jgi:hypothetical protein
VSASTPPTRLRRLRVPDEFERIVLRMRFWDWVRRAGISFEHRGEAYASLLLILALERSRRVLDHQDASGFVVLDGVAAGFAERGRLWRARVINSWAAGGLQRVLGPEDPATLTAVTRRARLLWQTGETQAAYELAARTFEASRQRVGEEAPETLDAMATLGVILADRGELRQALELQQRACAARATRFGDGHPDTVQSLTDVFMTLAELREVEQASALLPRLHHARSEVFRRRNNAAETLDWGAIFGGNLVELDVRRGLDRVLATGEVPPRRGR